MPLEPRVARLVALLRTLDRRDVDEPMAVTRRQAAEISRRLGFLVMPKGPEPASTVDHNVPVAGGRILVRVMTPHGVGPFPLHLFIHGGGWCAGTVDERDPHCRQISAGARCIVASVDYRLAPENAYPTPGEDCYAALTWLIDRAATLGIDPSRVSVGGESAGGNLAAVLCLMARDRSGPTICHQWLDVPGLDLTLSQPSIESVPDGHLLDRASIDRYLECYLEDPSEALDPYASPLLAPDLSGLPPAWIMSAEYDKLRDDGRAYAEALRAAGVPAEYTLLAGHVHPSFAFTRILPSAAAYERRAIDALARALHP